MPDRSNSKEEILIWLRIAEPSQKCEHVAEAACIMKTRSEKGQNRGLDIAF